MDYDYLKKCSSEKNAYVAYILLCKIEKSRPNLQSKKQQKTHGSISFYVESSNVSFYAYVLTYSIQMY